MKIEIEHQTGLSLTITVHSGWQDKESAQGTVKGSDREIHDDMYRSSDKEK